jgi:hypothetical protein
MMADLAQLRDELHLIVASVAGIMVTLGVVEDQISILTAAITAESGPTEAITRAAAALEEPTIDLQFSDVRRDTRH